MPVISGFDINGNGSGVTPLPGLSYNCLNISCGKSDLAAAVANWNSTYAGKKENAELKQRLEKISASGGRDGSPLHYVHSGVAQEKTPPFVITYCQWDYPSLPFQAREGL